MIIRILSFIFLSFTTFSFAQNIEDNQFKLAQSYEQKGDFINASRLFGELANKNLSKDEYLDAYVRTVKIQNKFDDILIYMQDRIGKIQNLRTYVYLAEAYWYKGLSDSSEKNFNRAIELISSKNEYKFISTSLVQTKQYNFAKKVLLQSRVNLKDDTLFCDELSQIYVLLGDKENAVNEILKILHSTRNLGIAQGRLYALMTTNEAKTEIKTILEKIYSRSPTDMYFLYLYVWFARTAQDFDLALNLTINLDKKQGSNYSEVLRFANQCKLDNQFEVAIKAYSEIIKQGKRNQNMPSAMYGLAQCIEQKNLFSGKNSIKDIKEIQDLYTEIIEQFPRTVFEYQGYYRLAKIAMDFEKDYNKAITFLKKITNKRLIYTQYGEIQLELSDLYIISGNMEAAENTLNNLLIDVKSHSYGKITNDDVVFKIAKLKYFEGKIDSTLQLLDNINPSSSSEVMNDNLEFKSFINKNKHLNAAMNLFSQAELLEFQKREVDAISKYEESSKLCLGEELEEMCHFRIAEILSVIENWEGANEKYEYILDKFPNSINKDLIYLNEGKNFIKLNKIDLAVQTFTKILVNYPKSIYFDEARKLIRELRDKEKQS
ncbi:MAG: hypothetical protein A2X64_06795 [Ignavibacteria bacterium GWF2_33_9]|nr:MAG: hypothetical protein A2X64_06795 [Ignavibacteria bacterium GWF2_33_9]